MLFSIFRALWIQLIVIAVIIAACSILVWVSSGREAALAFISIGVIGMKGPWVWTFGYGLATFVSDRGKMLPLSLNGMLVPNEVSANITARIERSTLHRFAYWYTVPITILGLLLTCAYGIPSKGISFFILLIAVCSIYYIAAFLLFHFVGVIAAFHYMFDSMDEVEFRKLYSPVHIENLTSYLSITLTVGLIAIYAGFRGTLTAGFIFHHDLWRSFLSIPLILFLPGTLFYNYYPRYVLRRIVQHRIFRAMERLGDARDEVGAQKIILDMKDASFLNAQILPFLDYKSIPSYIIAILFAASVAYHNDPAVKTFAHYVIHLGSH